MENPEQIEEKEPQEKENTEMEVVSEENGTAPVNSEEPSEEFRFAQGRGGYRGRGWNGGGGAPRFRGRGGFGPPGTGPPMRGGARGGAQPPQFHRGRGGGPPGRFPGPGFDPSWGPPGMMGHNMMGGPQGGNFGPPGMGPPMMQELWIETKTEEGKSYFYHALSRDSTWTRPEGAHVKIMTQTEFENMNKQQLQQQQQQQQQQQPQQQIEKSDGETAANPDGSEPQSGNTAATANDGLPKPETQPQMPAQFSRPPPGQFNMGIPNQMPQFGMPPPGFPAGFPQGPWNSAPGAGQWHGMPMQPPHHQDNKEPLIGKSGEIDVGIISRAAEWAEYRAPDGRPYYHHSVRGESVWEKPQAIRDLEAARMAAFANNAPPTSAQPPTATQMALANSMKTVVPNMMGPGVPMPQINQPPPGQNSIVFDPLGFIVKSQDQQPGAPGVTVNDAAAKNEKKKKLEAEKKKKEEEDEKAKQLKTQDKSRPISSTPISGTPWCVVWTGDGRVFFYNPSTRTSVWERPEDLLERADVDKAIATPPDQLVQTPAGVAAAAAAAANNTVGNDEKKVEPVQVTAQQPDTTVTTPQGKKRSDSESSEASDEIPSKKLKTEPVVVVAKPNEKKTDPGKEAAVEAEVRAARERALVPLEIRVKSFKEMLKEKDVSAFSTWEKELHKIVFDPRYLLLTSRERKQVFEKYVKERAEEERKEKRNKMRQRRDDFRSLLESANLHGKSSFSEFIQKCGKDDRFKLIEKVRERESLFNEYIVDVRKQEREDKMNRKEQVKKDFIQLLRETSSIDRHSRWSDIKKKIDSDSRYRAVENSMMREDYYHFYLRILKDEKKKSKEEKSRDRDRKDKKKDKERDRDRDRGEREKKSKKDDEPIEEDDKIEENDNREDGEHPLTSDDEAERQQKERDKKLRAELSIKEREKEVQRTLATHLRDRDKEREHHKRDEAMRHFSALLADLVRNADLTWKEVKKQLKKDHRWELVEQLERDDRERLFNEHIEGLAKKKRDKFREMLDEMGQKFELTITWKEVKKMVKDDPRYLKFNSSEKCEREFKEYVKDKTLMAKAAFRELLLECKLITHKSMETLNENSNYMKEIEDILKNDKRYLILDHIHYERSQIIMGYLEELHKRGPPPPPTASESTRRK